MQNKNEKRCVYTANDVRCKLKCVADVSDERRGATGENGRKLNEQWGLVEGERKGGRVGGGEGTVGGGWWNVSGRECDGEGRGDGGGGGGWT